MNGSSRPSGQSAPYGRRCKTSNGHNHHDLTVLSRSSGAISRSKPRTYDPRLLSFSKEFLLMICDHLSLPSLLSLSRVNKGLRQFLIKRASVWRGKLLHEYGTAFYGNMYAWAALLCGQNICCVCSSKKDVKLLVEIRRRACKHCVKKHLLPAFERRHGPLADITRILDVHPSELHAFLPCVAAPSAKTTDNWKYNGFWDGDVEEFLDELRAFRSLCTNTTWGNTRDQLKSSKRAELAVHRRSIETYMACERERRAECKAGRHHKRERTRAHREAFIRDKMKALPEADITLAISMAKRMVSEQSMYPH
ncbi:hypothetical protein OF83DRAFT_88117 [Amylostereum chailletii]|nr:hypothetical protein OF83DRAFT_88117 [Amylostereum chailletii]